ncbi:MAG: LysR family transcriptional regulator [Elusimicrobia bacterium]|nr:LysR family transcriptional regulator [Elusimicrobiota bacterium]
MLIETCKVFRDLADTGSFSKAAELNFLTQSAVSQQIKNLEHSLGCPLVGRGNRTPLRLTPAGLIFYRMCRKTVASYEDMRLRLRHLAEASGARHVRVSAIYSVGTHLLQGYVRGFLARHPGVQIDIDYQKAARIYDDILRDRVDLSIMAYPSKRQGIQITPLLMEEMVLICRPDHALAARQSIDAKGLRDQEFIALDPSSPTRKALDKTLRGLGLRMEVKLELDNIETVKSAVAAGTGVAIVPENTVLQEVRQGSVCAVRFARPGIRRPLCIITRKGRKPDRTVQTFLDHVRSAGPRPGAPRPAGAPAA